MTPGRLLLFRLQYLLGRLTIFITAPAVVLLVRLAGYRIRDQRKIRTEAEAIFKEHPGPWLICANHLTLIDSVIIAWAMFPFYRYMRDYRLLPWNMPEKTNFQRRLFTAVLCYLLKCIPVVRRGSRESVKTCLAQCGHVLDKRESIMIFPEGTRSRSGRIDTGQVFYGPGRLAVRHPACRVLCVYLRGDRQASFSNFPRFFQKFSVSLQTCAIRPEGNGLKAQRECSRQIVETLARMERRYFDSRGQ